MELASRAHLAQYNVDEPVTSVARRGFAHRSQIELTQFNHQHRESDPRAIINFALSRAQTPVIFTNFRPLAIVFLYEVIQVLPDIPVVWVDHGFNTPATYRHIERVVELLNLQLTVYTPRQSAAHYIAINGEIPAIDSPEHTAFTRLVKLEPFQRAMDDIKPDMWLTGIRHDQNAFRKDMNIFSHDRNNAVRIAPMFHLTQAEVEVKIKEYGLPDNHHYVDPTKGEMHRECGIIFEI
jgi:phosphoadenosine phosphosulfate reductase